MKKFAVFAVIAVLLLAGCGVQSPTPASTPPVETPDIETLVRQSVDEAVRETVDRYEAERKEREEEIAELKAQLEELTALRQEDSNAPAPEEPAEPDPAEESTPKVSAASQLELDPAPQETESQPQASQQGNTASSNNGFDLKNLYPSFVWENAQPSDETWGPEGDPEDEEQPAAAFGFLREDDALEVIRLTNLERENHGLEPLEMDDDLMALAQIRAEEVSVKYSHERPDGTRVVAEHPGFGENVGGKASAEKQVTSWMNSEGHCANILRERFHHIGVGCYQAPDGGCYWVQIFSR